MLPGNLRCLKGYRAQKWEFNLLGKKFIPGRNKGARLKTKKRMCWC